jgi:MFS family permease
LIGPAYYFSADGKDDDPKYEISLAIPDFTDAKYGLLAGPTFTLVYATLILFTGTLSDNYSRRFIFSISAILWSFTSIGTAFSHSLVFLSLNRMLLGVFEAFAPPAAYSMIADYFPPEKRTTANAVLSLGIFVGAGLASITTIMIGWLGWRDTYFIVGCFGIVFGIIAMIFVKDPVRGRFDPKKVEEIKVLVTDEDEEQLDQPPPPKESLFKKYINGLGALIRNDCTFWILMGGMCRFWQGYTISYFCIKYFAIYKKPAEYGIANALCVLIGGFISNMFAGYISDKYEKVNYRTKSWVAVGMSAIGVPVSLALFLVNASFGFSITMLFLDYLLCEGWISPSYAMIQAVIDVKYKGVAIGVFSFGTTISGTLAAVILGLVITAEDAEEQQGLGEILAISTAIPCFLASLCFYRAGTFYVEFKKSFEEEKVKAMSIAVSHHVELRSESI